MDDLLLVMKLKIVLVYIRDSRLVYAHTFGLSFGASFGYKIRKVSHPSERLVVCYSALILDSLSIIGPLSCCTCTTAPTSLPAIALDIALISLLTS